MKQQQQRRVVVTGIGAVSAGGIGVEALWQAVQEGRSLGREMDHFDMAGYKTWIGAYLDHEVLREGRHGIEPGDEARWDRSTLLGLVAAREAFSQLGLEGVEATRCGCCVGTAIGGVGHMEEMFYDSILPEDDLDEDEPPDYVRLKNDIQMDWLHGYLCSTTSLEIARLHGLRGPVSCVSTGCTAGVDAIGFAIEAIRRGDADLMVTGATEAPITPVSLTAFDRIDAVSRRNNRPDKASRPFDRDRDGFLIAEGAGILVLEERQSALRRGAPILGELVGFGTNCNAHHMTGIDANGLLLAKSMELALEDAGIPAADIDYINAHGSSTPQNDRAETSAYKLIFGERAYQIPISSTKSIIGHPLGAASALELVVCVESIRKGWVHPTANLENDDEACDLDYVPGQGREHAMSWIISNASGFSGLHSAVILEKGAAQ